MSAFTLYMLTAVGDGLIALAAALHMACAVSDRKPVKAIGWSAWMLGAVIVSFAFATRALSL